mgnify:CR=1 FL=1
MKKNMVYKITVLLLSAVMCISPCTGFAADSAPNVKATWDCVWFGSYPQAEIVESADKFTAIDQNILKDGDVIEDAELYKKLAEAEDNQWEGNDITLEDGEKYRRVQSSDTANPKPENIAYKWESDGSTYHYFKYEPVKWRVLNMNGEQDLMGQRMGIKVFVRGGHVHREAATFIH